VRSVAGGEWNDPIMLMNAYYFDELEFEVSDSFFRLTFIGIDENYFYDYDRFLDQSPDFPDTVVIELRIDDITRDKDGDNLPDLLEKEMLLSSRLPDSDGDGKADNVDYCPLGIPVQSDSRLDIYKSALIDLMKLDDLNNLVPKQDTAWTRYFGTYYIHEPTIAYIAFPGEPEPPELTDLPIVLIQARSPLYFGKRQRYGSFTGGIIPHLVFYKPEIDFFEKHATMTLEFVERVYRHESATMHFEKSGEHWVVTQVTKDE
jgi:hypothetical protein